MEQSRTIWQKSIVVLFCQLIFLMLVLAFSGAAHAQEPSKADTLLTKISQSYKGTYGAWQVMELSACGLGDTADAKTLLDETITAVKGNPTDATQLQRNIIALTAAGYDCTALPDGSKSVDAVAKMAVSVEKGSYISAKVSALWAYASGGYAVPKAAVLSEEELIAAICDAQLSDGGFAFSGSISDPDMTAMAINALLSYAENNVTAKNAAEKARNALIAMQHADGTWGGAQTAGNANSTAFAIVALCALGEDPTKPLGNSSVAPLDALLPFANSNNDGFLYNGNPNALATEQGFRALVSCKGFTAAGGAYNIYTQASKATATFEPVKVEETKGSSSSTGDSAAKSSDSKKTSDTKKAADKDSKTKKSAADKARDAKAAKKSSSASKDSASNANRNAHATSGIRASAASFADDDDFDDSEDVDDSEDSDSSEDEDEFEGDELEDDEEAFDDGSLDEEDASVLGEGELSAGGSSSGASGFAWDKAGWALIGAGILLVLIAAGLYLYWTKRGAGK